MQSQRTHLIPPAELTTRGKVYQESSLQTQCPESMSGTYQNSTLPEGKQEFSINHIVQFRSVLGMVGTLQNPSSQMPTRPCKQAFLRIAVSSLVTFLPAQHPNPERLSSPWSPWPSRPPSSLTILDESQQSLSSSPPLPPTDCSQLNRHSDLLQC